MNRKCLVLVSGGLDSQLALALMLKQNIEVEAVSFFSHFSAGLKSGKIGYWIKVMENRFNIKMHYVFLREEFVEMIKNAKYGYGAGINPCIDCKILMFKKAAELMNDIGASFIVSGEVLGQRPMSQLKQSMFKIENESGLDGLILRPLSAKLLPLTKAEEEGIVDRNKLLGLSGRSRKEQNKLAEYMGVENYPQPAGGCILTDKIFSLRMRDAFKYGYKDLNEFIMLQSSRLFRFNNELKGFLSRNRREGDILYKLADKEDILLQISDDFPGPLFILRGKTDENAIQKAAAVVKHYSKKKIKDSCDVDVLVKENNKVTRITVVEKNIECYIKNILVG